MCKTNKKDQIKKIFIVLIGKTEDINLETKNISEVISEIKPDNIIFFTNTESKKLATNVISTYNEITNENLPKRNTIQLKSNNLEETYTKIMNQIKDVQKREIYIYKTYGSETMNTASILIKDKFPEITLYSNDTDKKDNPLIEETLHFLQLKDSYKAAKKYFNSYQYSLVKEEFLEYDLKSFKLETNQETGIYIILSDIYENYDKGNYDIAYKHFLESMKSGALRYTGEKFPHIKQQLTKNRNALSILSDITHKDHKKYYLAAMIRDGLRRMVEERYNDAMLRFYRALTIVSEIELGEIPIDPYDVKPYQLKQLVSKEVFKELMEKLYKINGTYHTCGLTCNFQFLSKIRKYNEVGKYFLKNINTFYKLASYRNNNTLAHGYENSNEKECAEMLSFVLDFARLSVENIDELLEEVDFPEL